MRRRPQTANGRALLAFQALALCGAAAVALPSIDDVQVRFVSALGGHTAILRPQSMTLRGTYTGYALSGRKRLEASFVTYWADFKRLDENIVAGRGTYRSGYYRGTAWSLDPAGKVQVLKGSNAQSVRRDADLYYWAHVQRYFRSMSVVGVQQFAGHRCYRVRGVTLWGNVNNQFYDADTGLLVGYLFHQWTPSGPEKAESRQVFDRYRSFDGLLIPTRITDYTDGHLAGITIYESVAFNDVDARMLIPPKAVRAAA